MSEKVILHGTLIDGNGGEPVKDSAIFVSGDYIDEVTVFDPAADYSNLEVIDATGKYIIPGLIEGHAHIGGHPKFIPTLQKSLRWGMIIYGMQAKTRLVQRMVGVMA